MCEIYRFGQLRLVVWSTPFLIIVVEISKITLNQTAFQDVATESCVVGCGATAWRRS
jgi:hypothetical protein